MTIRISTRPARAGAAALVGGLLLGLAPALVTAAAADAAVPTKIAIRADHATYTAGGRVTLAAHLNVANQLVTFYEAYRGQGAHVISRIKTNGAGNVAIVGPAHYSATFTVYYAGSKTYAPSRARTSVTVRARMAIKASGGAKRKGYRLYRQSKKATVAAAVAPSKTGRRVLFRLQVRRNGHYKTIDTRRYTLRKGSAVAVTYRGKAGKRYRVRAEYGGDTVNAKNHTKWIYSRFRH